MAGCLQNWELEPSPCLALVLLIDRFSRQLWPDEARTFAGDERALQLSAQALSLGWLAKELQWARRQFWLMPMLHSEKPAEVQRAITLLWIQVDQASADLARCNLEQLQRFGRYP